MSDLDLRAERYDGPAALALTVRVQQEYVERYGGPDETPVDPEEFAHPAGRFLVGYVDEVPVACGGIRVPEPGVAEIKRMYVVPEQRGRGLSRLVLGALEDAARDLGCARVRLETGLRQPEAIRLYETSGYAPIEGFGHYRDEPLSRCFGKMLEADAGG